MYLTLDAKGVSEMYIRVYAGETVLTTTITRYNFNGLYVNQPTN
jgi:hypothetical protein